MPDCTQKDFGFPSFDRRKIEANFAGGDVSSDGGILLLREADTMLYRAKRGGRDRAESCVLAGGTTGVDHTA